MLIGGVEFLTKSLIDGFSIENRLSDRLGTASFTIQADPATSNALVIPGAVVGVYAVLTPVGSPPVAGAQFGAALPGATGGAFFRAAARRSLHPGLQRPHRERFGGSQDG